MAARLYGPLRRAADLDSSATRVARAWRAHHGRDLSALARHLVKAEEVYRRYLWERSHDHVRAEWEAARRAERLAARQKELAAAAEAERQALLAHLGTVLRWPWEEEWQKRYGDRGREEWACTYRLGAYGDPKAEYSEEKPIYNLEDNAAARRLGRATRAWMARTLAWRLRREQERAAKAAAERAAWEASERERQRHVTVRLRLEAFAPAAEAAAAAGAAGAAAAGAGGGGGSGSEEDGEADGEEELLGIDLEEEADAALAPGFPVEARFGGGDHYYQGTIYQVNPTKYTTTEGVREYPRGTLGVLYDDGDVEPAVPRALLRVVKLKPGMRVEVNYEGAGTYYPATVAGENVRDGRVLSYQVEYDDGEQGRAVPRARIKVDAAAFAQLQEDLRRRRQRRLVEAQRARAARARRRRRARAWAAGAAARRRAFAAARRPDPARRREEWGAYNLSAPFARPLPPPARDLVAAVRAARAVFHGRRPALRAVLRLEYTRAALRFGWREARDPARPGMNYYESVLTGESSWEIPFYDYAESAAAARLQSMWRAHQGRREFQRYLAAEGVPKLAADAEAAGLARAWVPGAGAAALEAELPLPLWLARAGFHRLAAEIDRSLAKKSRAASSRQRSRQSKKRPDGLAGLSVAKFLAFSEDQLKKHGVDDLRDRQALLRFLGRPAAERAAQLAFVNGWSGPEDPRGIFEAVAAGYPDVRALMMKRWHKNEKRAERLAEAVCGSRFPVTYAQVRAFVERYADAPGKAQENVREIVDVPTTSTAPKEEECFAALRKGAARLKVLLGNLHLDRLRAEAQLALFQAQTLVDHAPPPAEDEDRARRATGPAAKAAWLLRAEVFAPARAWHAAAVRVQQAWRRYLGVAHFRALLLRRLRATVYLQAAWRRALAYRTARGLRAQRDSPWEELFDEGARAYYYFNKETEASAWSPPPGLPYRPMVRDFFTARLLQAWPHLELAEEEGAPAPPGYCMRCKEERASRACHECTPPPGAEWGNGQYHYCFLCFGEAHAGSPQLVAHAFDVTADTSAGPLLCSTCGELATRHCFGLRVKPWVFEDLGRRATAATGQQQGKVSREDFVDFVKHAKLEYSTLRTDALYATCTGPNGNHTAYQFWLAVQRELEGAQEDCGDNFCAQHWREFHRRGKRARHVWLGYQEGSPACVACRVKPAAIRCLQCNDLLCATCAPATHKRGKKAAHVLVPFKEEWTPPEEAAPRRHPLDSDSTLTESTAAAAEDDDEEGGGGSAGRPETTAPATADPYCRACTRRVANDACPFCQEKLCDSCCRFEHPRRCPVRATLADDELELPTECALCGKPPDVQCEQCGEVYCSVKWMGNPGCFVKHHRKGNRKTHTKAPYTFVARLREREAALKAAEVERLTEAQAQAEREVLRASELDGLRGRWAEQEAARLEEEALALARRKQRDRRLARLRRVLHLPAAPGAAAAAAAPAPAKKKKKGAAAAGGKNKEQLLALIGAEAAGGGGGGAAGAAGLLKRTLGRAKG